MNTIIYHDNCNDGFCAAWLCREVWPDADYVPAQYGQEPPDVSGKDVLIADFSWPREHLVAMAECARLLVVLDHHKTAAADLAGLNFAVFDMKKSGARLTWEWLVERGYIPGQADRMRPWLVDYTEDRDLWSWQLPNSREINAAIASYPRDFDVWDRLHRGGTVPLITEGRAILRYQDTLIQAAIERAVPIEIGGHVVPAANTTILQSEIAGKLAEGQPFGAVWFDLDQSTRVYSLRSRDGGIDVSEVARTLGGGGHRNAAGFKVYR